MHFRMVVPSDICAFLGICQLLAGSWILVGLVELSFWILGADAWGHAMKSFLVAWLFQRLTDASECRS